MELIKGKKYNWKCSPERLVYMGRKGQWHQFELIDDPGTVWCEVLKNDLTMLEETSDDSGVMTTSAIVNALKTGVYDGTTLMQAWCRLRQQGQELDELREAARHVVKMTVAGSWNFEARQNIRKAVSTLGVEEKKL